jgi:hypothetical protein
MRITVEAKIERADGSRQTVEISCLERAPDPAPRCGIGVLLSESRDLLGNLQRVVLREQADEIVAAARQCRRCSRRLAVKGSAGIVYRTAFGKVTLEAPRLYSRCSACGARVAASTSFSPLALALPERSHPQWVWLQTRYASVMSYRLARSFLATSFAGATDLPASSIRSSAQRIGARLEKEMQQRAEAFWTLHHDDAAIDARAAVHALQIDAGYVRSIPQTEGANWISVIASKVVRPESLRTHAHAYAGGGSLWRGDRQEAFLASVGIGGDVPVVLLCDGGEDIGVSRLGNRSLRILDWFHIGMRFKHLQLAPKGLPGVDDVERERLLRRAEGAKWLLWHGRAEPCLARLQELRRDTGWVGKRNALGRLVAYLENGKACLTNYAARRARGLPISSAGAESAVDHVVGQRMKRNGHARWTRRGANHLLQVRCAVLNGQDVRNFKRWYPTQRPLVTAA